jgi:predicted HTH transcriptional regulator
MNPSEAKSFNEGQFNDLRRLVSRGEGLTLEFKRKAAHPDKIVRELIAFANTNGGVLLIGIDDNGTIPGVKYPEEELMAIEQALHKYCQPAITMEPSIIPVAPNRFIVHLNIEVNSSRPHYFKIDDATRESFVRSGDMSVKASREMLEIVRRSKTEKNIRFTFGQAEKTLMEYLDHKNSITLAEFRTLARLNRFQATRKLILLVLAK